MNHRHDRDYRSTEPLPYVTGSKLGDDVAILFITFVIFICAGVLAYAFFPS